MEKTKPLDLAAFEGHTPGPWHARSDETPWTEGDAQTALDHGEPFGTTEVLFSIGDYDTVAYCPWRGGDTQQDQTVLRANAALIAAAPLLLAECKRQREEIAALRAALDQILGADGELENMDFAQARAALAATGKGGA